MVLMNKRTGSGVDVNRATASSIPNRKVRIRIRTLTSQSSQLRSSKFGCIPDPVNSVNQRLGSPLICAMPVETSEHLPVRLKGPPHAARSGLLIWLSSQLGDHGKQRHIERNDDAANGDAQ